MYLIIVYDINVERINSVRQYLKTQLTWIQNSVFEGEVTRSQFEEIKTTLKELIDKEYDSVIFYVLRTKSVMKKEVMGVVKGEIMNII